MDNDYEIALEEDLQDILDYEGDNQVLVEVEKKTAPVLFIYEKINFIEQRVEQLNNNYKTTIPEEVKRQKLTSSIDIAELEYQMMALPKLYIYRDFPNGTYEKWAFNDFEVYP